MNKQHNKSEKELIQEYISGDVSENGKETVKTLLENHPELNSYMRKSERIWDLLDSVDTVEPNPNYISNFWTRLREEQNSASLLEKIGRLSVRWLFAGSFATLLIITAISVNMFILNTGTDSNIAFNKQDEILLRNLDKAITKKTAASLEVFGPWEE